MKDLLEQFIARIWNRTARAHEPTSGLSLGRLVSDGQPSTRSFVLPHGKRAEHVAILGKTGTGKSSLIRALSAQDIRANLGFAHIDLHGDTTPYVLQLLAVEEQRRHVDLSDRIIIIEPADAEWSVGLNPLEAHTETDRFVHIADVAQILKQRWHLDTFGARTEELLRNSLLALSETHQTLLELSPLLTNPAFRTQCLGHVQNAEVRAYFTTRYDAGSEAMQATWRDAVLNKISAFTADVHFRHLLGQVRSSFSLIDALDRACWVLLNIEKGKLGEHASTLGSLFLTTLKNALFARHARSLFTVYADELQNLVAYDSGIDTLLSEARKFSIGFCCGNQYLDQYPPQIRAAILSIGTHVCFQLSGSDADRIAAMLGGGKYLQELLKNLPPRHFIVKSGHHRWYHAAVPDVPTLRIDTRDLYDRCRRRWARPRREVEAEIAQRQRRATASNEEVLHAWE